MTQSERPIHLPQLGPQQDLYKDRYQRIYRVKADFDGITKEYFVRDSGRRAGLVVVRIDSVLLVRQYRLLIHGLSWEIPGGSINDGETPEQAAVRECFEETGIECTNLKPLLDFQPGLDTFNNPTFVFSTTDFVETPNKQSDPLEVVHREWVSLDRCIAMIFEHQIVDSFSIVALFAYDKLNGASG